MRTSAARRDRAAAWRRSRLRCGSNAPSAPTSVAAAEAPINGRCSVSTRCTPTASAGPLARERDGVLERRARRHDRRRRHDAAVVRLDDAAVDGLGDPEVVGVDDELRAPSSLIAAPRTPSASCRDSARRGSRASEAAKRRAPAGPLGPRAAARRPCSRERRGIQHAELQRVRGDVPFRTKRPEPVQHEAVDEPAQ